MTEKENLKDPLMDELMKKSLLKIPSADFTDRIMEKIEAKKPVSEFSLVGIKLSWVFLAVAVILLPFLLKVFAVGFAFPFLANHMGKITLVLMIGFAIILLLQFDNLLSAYFGRKKEKISF